MDKKVELKKQPKKRKNLTMEQYCYLSTDNYLKELSKFYINNNDQNPIFSSIIKELKKKQQSYKCQDVRKKKYNVDTFITIDDIVGKLLTSKMICYYCKKEVCIFYDTIRQSNQWTLERLDNLIGHSDTNTVIACLDCNLKRRTSSSNAFCFSKQLVIKKV